MIFVSYFEVEEKLVRLLQKQISFFEKAFRWSPKIIGGGSRKKKMVACSQKNWSSYWKKNPAGTAVGKVLERQSQNQHQRHQNGVLKVLLCVLGAPAPIQSSSISFSIPTISTTDFPSSSRSWILLILDWWFRSDCCALS